MAKRRSRRLSCRIVLGVRLCTPAAVAGPASCGLSVLKVHVAWFTLLSSADETGDGIPSVFVSGASATLDPYAPSPATSKAASSTVFMLLAILSRRAVRVHPVCAPRSSRELVESHADVRFGGGAGGCRRRAASAGSQCGGPLPAMPAGDAW